jgi:hypothetical protein
MKNSPKKFGPFQLSHNKPFKILPQICSAGYFKLVQILTLHFMRQNYVFAEVRKKLGPQIAKKIGSTSRHIFAECPKI